jgi:hypothetical protein
VLLGGATADGVACGSELPEAVAGADGNVGNGARGEGGVNETKVVAAVYLFSLALVYSYRIIMV